MIVEDHDDARQTIQKVVEEAFDTPSVHNAGTLTNARKLLNSEAFDLIVLDLGLPDGKGEDFIPEILTLQPNAYVVISTIHDESERLLHALENGAKGYLLKEQPFEFLVGEFKGITKGKPPLAPAITRRLLEHIREHPANMETASPSPTAARKVNVEEAVDVSKLTKREHEIFILLAKGFNKPEIAGFLDISKHTVATHVTKIYSRLSIVNRSEATLIARDLGLI
ncbi:MAG: response regulator transcription factor [Rhizobiaceae bacterium]